MKQFVRTWKVRLEISYHSSVNLDPLRGRYKGNERYTAKFDAENHGRVIQCFRAAQKVVKNEASFADLAAVTNAKMEEEGWTLKGKRTTFNTSNAFCWFKNLGGKEMFYKEKPALTPETKKARKEWHEEMKRLMEKRGKDFNPCYLSEKWFHVNSRQKKIKILEARSGESDKNVNRKRPTTRSRRFPVKVNLLLCCVVVMHQFHLPPTF